MTHHRRGMGDTRKPSRRMGLLLLVLAALSVAAVAINLRFAGRSSVRAHVRAGIQLYEAGDIPKAVEEWRIALRQDPTYPDTYKLLGKALIDQGSPAEAVPLLQQLRRIDPRSEHLYCRLAEALALSEAGNPVYDSAKEAVAREPACPRAHALFGIANGNRQNHAVAVSELSRALLLDPSDNRVALSLAQAQINAADLEGTERTVRGILERDPNNAKAYLLLGSLNARRTPTPENVKVAMEAFSNAYRLDPELKSVVPEMGRLRLLAGDYRGAVEYLGKAWQAGPQTQDIAFNLAKAYRGMGDIARANQMSAAFKRLSEISTRSAALEKRLGVNPQDVASAIALAELQVETKDWEAVTPLIQTLLNVRPEDSRVLQAAARVAEGTGDTESAAVLRERLAQRKSRGNRKAK